MKHILTSKALIFFMVLILALNLTACGETSTEQAVKTEDNVENKAVEKAEKEVLNYQQIHREQVKQLKYPNDYEPWNYPAQEIVGNERTFYVDGHLVNMPNYIGEWEELLGVKFIEIPEFYGAGSENYTYNRVYVLDENYVEYTFKINTESYEPKEDQEEELEQLRKTETLGFEIHYAENWKHNLSLKDYISLLPDKNIFTDDVEAVNNELAELYGAELEPLEIDEAGGYHLFVDKFDKGFTVDWECSQDGKARHLDVEYTPMPYLAYYKFINGEIPGYYDEDRCDYYNDFIEPSNQSDEERYNYLIDISYDGIRELLIHRGFELDALFYNSKTGKLQIRAIGGEETKVSNYGVMIGTRVYYEDGYVCWGYDPNAEFIDSEYFMLEKGDIKHLVTIQECKTHGEYFINGKLATEEQVRDCKTKYGAVNISFTPYTKEEVLEMIKQDSDLIYAGIRRHNQNQKEGKYIIETYDDSTLEDSTFDEAKSSLLQLLLDIRVGYMYLKDHHEAVSWTENSAFALIDINGDGQQELLTSTYAKDGVLREPLIYIKDAEGNYVEMCNVDGYIPETGELVSSEGSIDEGAAIYIIEEESLRKVKEVWMDEFYNAWKVEDGIQTGLSEEEFYREYLSYANKTMLIEGELLTMGNIEKVLGIKVCGNGRIIRDAE